MLDMKNNIKRKQASAEFSMPSYLLLIYICDCCNQFAYNFLSSTCLKNMIKKKEPKFVKDGNKGNNNNPKYLRLKIGNCFI